MAAVNVEEYQELKKKADQLKSEADRARGALDTQMQKLKDDWGQESLESAEIELNKKREAEVTAAEKYNTAKKEFLEVWGEKLGVG